MSEPKDYARLQYIYVTTTGRKSGLPREIEIWFVERAGKFYILAEHFFKANWVQNIQQNPCIHLRFAKDEFPATARVLDETRDAETWQAVQRLSREKYGWGEGLPVEISLDEGW
ncbi:MAG: nitroreductase family deazaflavin-dependent oxidoreductase [Acidobacteriota bacterium]